MIRLILILALACSGCTVLDAIEARQWAALGERCITVGYAPDTDPWRDCVIELAAANRQASATAWAGMQQAGQVHIEHGLSAGQL